MVSSSFKHVIAATVASAMAISLVAPAFAESLPPRRGPNAPVAGTPKPGNVEYRRHKKGLGVGGAAALGIVGLGVAAAIVGQQQRPHDGYGDPAYRPRYAPGYQPRYAPAYQPQQAPVYRGYGEGEAYRQHRGYRGVDCNQDPRDERCGRGNGGQRY